MPVLESSSCAESQYRYFIPRQRRNPSPIAAALICIHPSSFILHPSLCLPLTASRTTGTRCADEEMDQRRSYPITSGGRLVSKVRTDTATGGWPAANPYAW